MKTYTLKNGVEINFEITEDNIKNNLFKLNLPQDEINYKSGNGEGVWACCGDEHYCILGTEINFMFIAKILNDSVYYPTLEYGDYVIAEYRGENRPVAILKELQAKHEFSQKNKDEVMNELFRERDVSYFERLEYRKQ